MAYEIYSKRSSGKRLFVDCGPFLLRVAKAGRELLGSASVGLLWDREGSRAAISSHVPPGVETYRISKSGSISCAAFLKETGLRSAGLLPVSWDKEENRLEWSIPAVEPQNDK